MDALAQRIDEMWESGSLDAAQIEEAIAQLDAGTIRVAEPADGGWLVNEWVKKAILLYFRIRKVEPMDIGGPTSSTRFRSSPTTPTAACASCRRAWRATARSSPRAAC